MSRTNDKDKDLTLRQAYERFVPLHVRQEYEFAVDTKNGYEARHNIRPGRRNTRTFHRFGDGAPVRRRNPAEISGEYKKLKSDVAAADRAAIGCFFRQLALCTVEARKGSPLNRRRDSARIAQDRRVAAAA